ncbi:hypothetical protein [Mycolicibacter sinensis]
MTMMQKPTGDLVLQSPSRVRERHLRSVPCGDELSWESTQMDIDFASAGLRDVVLRFSDALDRPDLDFRVAVITNVSGQPHFFGSPLWLGSPVRYIDAADTTDTGEPESIGEFSDVVEAFEDIRAELRLTQKQMFAATGIRKRTFHSWRSKPPGSRPRVASQGLLWQLADTVEELRETVDRPLPQWLQGDRRRMEALLDGRFDDLIDLAVNLPARAKQRRGTSAYTGIAEDIEMPVIRRGKTTIEDVEDGLRR